MDVEMGDGAFDIDIDVGAGVQTSAQPQQQQQQPEPTTQSESVPAAYFEDLQPQKPWPESLNLQGVGDFDPNDPLYYAMEALGAEPRVKQLRWVNDSSVNLEFYSAEEAAVALTALTHPDTNPSSLAAQTARPAKPYSKKPDSMLVVRETNAGDQKPKGAANRSNYYQRNPDVRGNNQREPRRHQPPKRDLLDYGDEDMGSRNRRRRSRSGDESMGSDSGVERRRNNYPRNDRNGRDRRDGRDRKPRDSGRLNADVDSYRPGGDRSNEPRHGRLRGRSASPASNDEGDGRFGFAEDTSNVRTRYRSRSRSRNDRRRREPSADRWTHDRANYGERGAKSEAGRWQKDAFSVDSSPMGNHRRSDAGSGGSLLSRMTKDGKPVNSLASRITRDDDNEPRPRSLASRITRSGEDDGYGRLKGDDSIPRDYEFDEPRPRRGLADRISRETEGINIRGAGSNGGSGINIRGVANGA
ncbi:uncharacterized protein EKO05_0007516 [Ascochyta rabiei]|uniref:Uncharacterized protein n=1 Tax=Didymella rabiei TaxID=5454 RepID=A0A162YL74_DIDRA|nr:uncharacterized protein EKO05_0007516 [Ascochyta rabiei]KZM20107.1 hypothetical protein ST47_g8774 [Ascochyta rabiei]UPX17141.1 hypothetical protein EKO05_0007516 [Ascochyta rabiei]